MIVFDKEKQKLLEYRSSNNFDRNIVNGLFDPEIIPHFKYQLTVENLNPTENFEIREEVKSGNSHYD